jgi:hypothetical protein
LFLRFKCHYGFSVSFCNPDAGHEKGHVENKVGYVRRNVFVPIPVVENLERWNQGLLSRMEEDFERPHYKKGLTIGVRAHTVVVYRENGSPLSIHRRSFGENRTDTADYATSLQTLLRRPRAWANSPFRAGLNETLRDHLDALSKTDLRRVLSVLSESASTFGFELAMESLQEAVRRGAVDAFSLQAISARIAYDGLLSAPNQGPDLKTYDRAFLDPEVPS